MDDRPAKSDISGSSPGALQSAAAAERFVLQSTKELPIPNKPFQRLEQDHAGIESILSNIISDAERSDTTSFPPATMKKLLVSCANRDTAIVLDALSIAETQVSDLSDDQPGDETTIHINDLKKLKDGSHRLSNDRKRGLNMDDVNRELSCLPFHSSIRVSNEKLLTLPLYSSNGSDPRDRINQNTVRQAFGVGNCHFSAGLISLAAFKPGAITNMIGENRDGTYSVTFPGQKPLVVEKPSAGKMLYYDQVSMGWDCTWPFVMQEAYGKHCDAKAGVDGGGGGSIGYDGLKKLTGGSVDVDETWCTTYDTMNRKLKDCQQNGRPVEASIYGELLAPFGLVDNKEDYSGLSCNHAYAVVDFRSNDKDPHLGEITIVNPNRSVPWESPPEGVTDLGDGKFKLNLETFSKIFSELAYASRAPEGAVSGKYVEPIVPTSPGGNSKSFNRPGGNSNSITRRGTI